MEEQRACCAVCHSCFSRWESGPRTQRCVTRDSVFSLLRRAWGVRPPAGIWLGFGGLLRLVGVEQWGRPTARQPNTSGLQSWRDNCFCSVTWAHNSVPSTLRLLLCMREVVTAPMGAAVRFNTGVQAQGICSMNVAGVTTTSRSPQGAPGFPHPQHAAGPWSGRHAMLTCR